MVQHGVVVPYPLQGHVNPCLSIIKLLVPKGFTFTVVLTEHLLSKLPPHSISSSSPIQFLSIPDGLPPSQPSGPLAFPLSIQIMLALRPAFVRLLHHLLSSLHPPHFIIADSFVTWAHPVASQFNLPRVCLFTANAHCFSVYLHTPVLISNGLLPVQDGDRIIDCISGLPPLRAGDVPQSLQQAPNFVLDQIKHIHEAAGVILNTVYETEREAVDFIQKTVPVYPIGPLMLMLGSLASDTATLGYWSEDRHCLGWLDTLPPSSVLYISFGSIATMGAKQMKELAEGIEASQQAFLWVIRSNASDGSVSEVLPEGFVDRTRERGLIISWAPQVEVLSHPSVGGFLTHCGWNSVTENISSGGVPMICWPQIAEQKLNATMLVDEWKVGVKLQEEDGLVKRGEVERAVKNLMQGELGREVRKRALELKEIAWGAVEEGGSSNKHLEAFIHDLKKLAPKHHP